MQKRRLLSLLILGLLVSVVSVQFVGVVSGQGLDDVGPPAPSAEQIPFIKSISESYTKWATGNGVDDTLSRFLFALVIGLLVYTVADRIPGLKDEGLGWARFVISAIFAFFGTAYLTSREISTLLVSYSGVGFALGFILPFLVLVFFSYDIATSQDIRNTWVKKSLIRIIWAVFAIYDFSRILTLNPGIAKNIELNGVAPIWAQYLLWGAFIIAVIIIIFTNVVISKLAKGETLNTIQSLRNEAMIVRANRDAHIVEGGAGK